MRLKKNLLAMAHTVITRVYGKWQCSMCSGEWEGEDAQICDACLAKM